MAWCLRQVPSAQRRVLQGGWSCRQEVQSLLSVINLLLSEKSAFRSWTHLAVSWLVSLDLPSSPLWYAQGWSFTCRGAPGTKTGRDSSERVALADSSGDAAGGGGGGPRPERLFPPWEEGGGAAETAAEEPEAALGAVGAGGVAAS